MNANPNQRPTISEIYNTVDFWWASVDVGNAEDNRDKKKDGYYGREIKESFEKADKEIPNISISYKKNPEAIYTSRAFTFSNLPKPINSSLITSYLEGIILKFSNFNN